MSFMRNFSHAASQFIQGAAAALPEAVDSYGKRKDAQVQEGRQDALTAYKAALEAGDVETMTLLEQQNPRMAPIMANLKASAKVSAQDTAQAAEMETGGFAAQYQGANSLQEVGTLQRDQLQAQQRAAMAKNRVGRFGGAPSAAMPPATPGGAPFGQRPQLPPTGGMAPAGAVAPPAAIGGAPPPLDEAAIARQRLNQRDFTRGNLENLRSLANDGSLPPWTDEHMNSIAREIAEANGLSPDDPQVLKVTGMQVRELVNLNNEKAKERTAELVTRQLQQADARKRLSMDDLQMEQLERQKMAENPQLYSPEALLAKGFSPAYQQFISQIPEPMRAEFISSPDALPQYQEFKKANKVADTGFDRGEQTLKLLGGMTAQQKYQESMNRQVIEYQKWTRNLDKQPSPTEQDQAYEQMAAMARKISGRVDPQAPAPGAGDTPEDYAKQLAALQTEDQQVELALKIVEKSPAGAREIATSPTITSDRIKQILTTGKDPNENLTPWSQQILGADLKMPGGGASLLERISLVGGGGGPPKKPLQGQPQPTRR